MTAARRRGRLGASMGRYLCCLGLLAALSAAARAADDGPAVTVTSTSETSRAETPQSSTSDLDLAAVVAQALENNPALAAIEERQREVDGGVQEVRADAFPQLDVVSSWSRSRNPTLLNSPDFDDIIEQFPGFQPGEQELWDLGLRVTQPIYSGGKVKAARRLAESAVDIHQAQMETARLNVALTAAEAYYGVLAARHAERAVASQEAARQAALEVVEARFELGDATRLEWLRAQASLAALAPRKAQAAGAVQVAESRLRLALGLPPLQPVTLVPIVSWHDGRESPGEPARRPSSEGPAMDEAAPGLAPTAHRLPSLLAVARRHRPELEDLRRQLEALKHQRHINVAGGRPQVDFSGRYAHQVSEPENLDRDLFADWLAAVSLRWSVFDGGRRKGERAQLDSQRQQLLLRQQDVLHQIAGELATILADYETARQRFVAAGWVREVAAEARQVALESYQQGVALQADLIAAQDEEIQAELDQINAFYDGRIHGVRLRRALGLLPTTPLPTDPSVPDRSLPDTAHPDSVLSDTAFPDTAVGTLPEPSDPMSFPE